MNKILPIYGSIIITFIVTSNLGGNFNGNSVKNHCKSLSSDPKKPQQNSHGGLIVYQNNGHGLVTTKEDLGIMDWNTAKKACDELKLNGYSDWHLPKQNELSSLCLLHLDGIGSFADAYYWSSDDYGDSTQAYKKSFLFLAWAQSNKSEKHNVRAVRTF